MAEPTGQTGADSLRTRIIRLTGALDIHTVPRLRKECLHEVRQNRHVPFSIEASGVTSIDGVGLGFIGELRIESLQRFNRPLVVAGFPDAINHLVGLSVLDTSVTNPPRPSRHNPITALGNSVEAILAFQKAVPLDMRGRITAFHWAKTPLGPLIRWPQSLRTIVVRPTHD